MDVLKVECVSLWAQLTLLQTSCNHIIWGRRQFLGQNLGQCRVIEVVRPGSGRGGAGKAGDGYSWEAGHCVDTDCGLYYSCSAGPGIHHITREHSILLLFIYLSPKWVQFGRLRKTFIFFSWFSSSSIDLIWTVHCFPCV